MVRIAIDATDKPFSYSETGSVDLDGAFGGLVVLPPPGCELVKLEAGDGHDRWIHNKWDLTLAADEPELFMSTAEIVQLVIEEAHVPFSETIGERELSIVSVRSFEYQWVEPRELEEFCQYEIVSELLYWDNVDACHVGTLLEGAPT